MHILLAEDDPSVASFIRRGLREERYTVDHAKDGEEALFMAQTGTYDLLILDLLLPKRNGMEVLRALRTDKTPLPVLVLTAKDRVEDKVTGLNVGADDYLTKPFRFDELLARIRALLRRRGELVPTVLKALDLEMDVLRHRITRAGRTIELTGLSNRRFFLERWEEECSRANRYSRPLSCLMIDINGFKKVNDRFGHHAGDLLLKEVAQQLKSHLRRTDLLARFGGDEFIIGLPETDLRQAAIVAEKLRSLSFQTAAITSHEPIAPISLSIGVSQAEAGQSPQKVIDLADADLYASRRSQNQNPSRSTISPRETGTG